MLEARVESPTGSRGRSVLLLVAATVVTLALGFLLELAFFGHGGHGSLSDLPRVFLHRRVGPGGFPYLDRMIEYPVAAGLLLYAAAVVAPTPVGVLAVTAIASSVLCVLLTVVLHRHAGARAWRWAAGTPLLFYAFQNWDVFAIAALVVGIIAFERKRDGLAGVALGVGAAIKLFPAVAVPPLVAIRLARGDRRGAARLAAGSLVTLLAINLPILLLNPGGWWWPFGFQGHRSATWGSAWFYVFRSLGVPLHGVAGAQVANVVSLGALTVAMVGLIVLTVRRNLSPWAAAGAAVALFIVSNKVYSPTYDLWLVVFFVMLPISRRLWLAFCAVDLAMFVTVYGYFHGYSSLYITHHALPAIVVARTLVLAAFVLVAIRRAPAVAPRPAPTSLAPAPVIAAPLPACSRVPRTEPRRPVSAMAGPDGHHVRPRST